MANENEVEVEVEVIKPELKSIKDIIKDLSEPVRVRHLSKKQQGGKDIFYLSWHNGVKYLDLFAPGWCYEIISMQAIAGKLIMITRITIPCLEGLIYREATGQEDETKDSWGDSSSNAESMSLRRAAAKFGLGLYLYSEDGYKLSFEIEKAKSEVVKSAVPKSETVNKTPEPETVKDEIETVSGDNRVPVSDEQLNILIKLCENPPKRKEPCDKNKVAMHYSNNRTELLEDLTALEAMTAIDAIKVMKDSK